MQRSDDHAQVFLRVERLHDFDHADDVAIEFRKVFGRDPIFSTPLAANFMDRVSSKKFSANAKTQDISNML